MSAAATAPDAPPRFVEVDAWKALGILAVVFIHGMRSPFDPGVSALEEWLGHATRFGVPAFLVSSGFLYATRAPVPWPTTRARLRRILVPYLLASAGAQVWRAAQGASPHAGSPWLDLLLGASFGPYYYVFAIVWLVMATPLFARLPAKALLASALGLVAAQWCVDAAVLLPLPFFWHLRNPLLWWAFFLIGWLLRLHYAPVRRFVVARRAPLLLLCGALALGLTVAAGLDAPRLVVRSAAWLDVYGILALIFVASSPDPDSAPRSPRALRHLAEATYAVYLFHPFFLYAAQGFVPAPSGRADPIAIGIPVLAGLVGSLALVRLGRRVLGTSSRDWIGA